MYYELYRSFPEGRGGHTNFDGRTEARTRCNRHIGQLFGTVVMRITTGRRLEFTIPHSRERDDCRGTYE